VFGTGARQVKGAARGLHACGVLRAAKTASPPLTTKIFLQLCARLASSRLLAMEVQGEPCLSPPPALSQNAGKTVLWFRADLRLHDNELFQRVVDATQVLPIFCFDPRQYTFSSWQSLRSKQQISEDGRAQSEILAGVWHWGSREGIACRTARRRARRDKPHRLVSPSVENPSGGASVAYFFPPSLLAHFENILVQPFDEGRDSLQRRCLEIFSNRLVLEQKHLSSGKHRVSARWPVLSGAR
jgi:hypothetical protein